MRGKDFLEVMTVLGNELAHCDPDYEHEGIVVAAGALMGYAAHRYPEVDQTALQEAFDAAANRPLAPVTPAVTVPAPRALHPGVRVAVALLEPRSAPERSWVAWDDVSRDIRADVVAARHQLLMQDDSP